MAEGFVKELRPAIKSGLEGVEELFSKNAVSKALKDLGGLADDLHIGNVESSEFAHVMRQGNIMEAFTRANPSMADVLENNKTIVTVMEREAKAMPESSLKDAADEALEVKNRIPDIDDVASAEDIKTKIGKDAELKNTIEDIDKKITPDSAGMKKYIFLGVAVVGAISVYEALEAYARHKTGCFLYTKSTDGSMAACKVVNMSCLNPEPTDDFPACTAEEMGEKLAAITCDDWDESSDGACYKCSYSNFDEGDLQNNQTLNCVEKPSISEAVGDFIYSNGSSILGGFSTMIKNIIYYGIIILAVIFGCFLLFYLVRAIMRKKPVQYIQQPTQQPMSQQLQQPTQQPTAPPLQYAIPPAPPQQSQQQYATQPTAPPQLQQPTPQWQYAPQQQQRPPLNYPQQYSPEQYYPDKLYQSTPIVNPITPPREPPQVLNSQTIKNYKMTEVPVL